MNEENIITLDLTGCKYLGEIHQRIKMAFDFPEWYGENWSAFWDLLWSNCDAENVIIKGENSLPDELKQHVAKIKEILDRNKIESKKFGWNFDYKIID